MCLKRALPFSSRFSCVWGCRIDSWPLLWGEGLSVEGSGGWMGWGKMSPSSSDLGKACGKWGGQVNRPLYKYADLVFWIHPVLNKASNEFTLLWTYFWLLDCVLYFVLYTASALNKMGPSCIMVAFIKHLTLFLVNRRPSTNTSCYHVTKLPHSTPTSGQRYCSSGVCSRRTVGTPEFNAALETLCSFCSI